MRRAGIVILILGGCAVVALAAAPLWLGAALNIAGRPLRSEFSKYERIGYSRFALHDVAVEHRDVRVTAERVESDTPLVWFFRKVAGNSRPIEVGTWEVIAKTPETDAAVSADGERPPMGAMGLRRVLRNVARNLDRWLPVAEVGAGSVEWENGGLEIGGASWKNGRLDVAGLRIIGLHADATVEFSESGVIQIAADALDRDWDLRATSEATSLTGRIRLWGQTGEWSASFGEQGWMPASASLTANDWSVPAAELRLGESYANVRGDARIDWRDGRFESEIAVNSESAPGSGSPPLAATLRGHGDLKTFVVESLLIDGPGIKATLAAPVEFDRSGRVISGDSKFTLALDLEALPWIDGSGVATGDAVVTAGEEGWPLVEAEVSGTGLSWEEVEVSDLRATARLDWPSLEIAADARDEEAGTSLSARGTLDLEKRELIAGSAEGTPGDAWVRRVIRGAPAFRVARVVVEAHGPFSEIEHSGTLEVEELAVRGMKSVNAEAAWSGTGPVADVTRGVVRAGGTEIELSGQIRSDSARLESFRLSQQGATALTLQTPATVRWSPEVIVETLHLAGGESSLTLSAEWSEGGEIDVSARNVSSAWWTDLVQTPDLEWRIASFELDGTLRDGLLEFQTSGSFSLDAGSGLLANVELSARGDESGIEIGDLRVANDELPIFTASGRLPVTIHPGGEELFGVENDGSFELRATSASSPLFWDKVKELTGVGIAEPSLNLELGGTWSAPRGTLRATARRVTIDSEKFDFPLPEIESLEIDANADRGELSLARLSMLVRGQAVRAAGRLPLSRESWSALKSEPMVHLRENAELHIEVEDAEIAALSALAPEFLAAEGTLRVNVDLRPGGVIEGVVQLAGASTRQLGPLGVLQQITADLRFSGRSVELKKIEATSGGRPVTLSGRIELPANAPPQFDVALKGSNLPLARRTGLLLRGDVDLSLRTEKDGVPLISGTARLRESLYLSDIRDLIPRGGSGAAGRPPYFSVQKEPFNKWKLAVDLRGDEFMRIRTTVFNGDVSAQFRISGTLGDPRAIGSATIDEGRLLFPFATFVVQYGSARLTVENSFEPQLDLAGVSRLQGFDVRVELKGTASEPELTFNSSPPLGSDVLLGMVMAGRPAEGDELGSDSRRYARLGTYVGRGILRSLSPGGDDMERLSLSSGANVSRQGRETFDIEYRLDERFSLVGEYDEFDEFNAGVKWKIIRDRRKVPKDDEDDESETTRAQIRVRGMGWLENWEQRNSLERLLAGQVGETLDANDVEDAAMLLLSALADEGFKDATVDVDLTAKDGSRKNLTFDSSLSTPLPRPLAAVEAEFRVNRGDRRHVGEVSIEGLTAIPASKVRGYFRPTGFLIATEGSRPHTEARLERAVDRLRDELNQLGYADAEVQVEDVSTGDSGSVSISIAVEEGPRWMVRSVRVAGAGEFEDKFEALRKFEARPWSRRWQQDVREAARRVLYAAGYPDAEVGLSREVQPVDSGVKAVDVELSIDRGGQVTLGGVRIEGAEHTRVSVIRRRIAAREGDVLNPIVLERSRYRLSRLGIFDSVEMRVEPDEGPVRDAVYVLKESRQWGAAVQLGYGTYEQFRAGLEVSKKNLFGLAHQTRLELVKSVKSSRGELSYTVPELFGESIDGTARLFGLEREEISFLRNEVGVNVALRRPIRQISGEASVGYTFQSLRNRENELSTAPVDSEDVIVGSIDLGLLSDWRDSPLRPRSGASLYGRLELASQALGGESDFQRLVVGGSVHTSLGTGRWLHFAMSHGVVTTEGSENDLLLPVNKRFFPGGDGSIRGYKVGEAAPRGGDGRFIGAKSYMRAGLDLEQALTERISIVAFFDALGIAARLEDYPFKERLYSTGLVLRYHTIVGPIQAGYGHNLNPRVDDPSGTLFFSVGYPF